MSEAQQVIVAIHDSKYGVVVRVFKTEEPADQWRTEIAKEGWSEEYDGPTPGDDEIGEAYFRMAADNMEYFSCHDAIIEGN